MLGEKLKGFLDARESDNEARVSDNNGKLFQLKKSFDELGKKFEELVIENVSLKKEIFLTEDKLRGSVSRNSLGFGYGNGNGNGNNGNISITDHQMGRQGWLDGQLLNNSVLYTSADSMGYPANCAGANGQNLNNSMISNQTQSNQIITKLEDRLTRIEANSEEKLNELETFSLKFGEQFKGAWQHLSCRMNYFKNLVLSRDSEDLFIIKNQTSTRTTNTRVYEIIQNFNIVPEFKKILSGVFEVFLGEKIGSQLKKYEKIILVQDSKLAALENLIKMLAAKIRKLKSSSKKRNFSEHSTAIPTTTTHDQYSSLRQPNFEQKSLQKFSAPQQKNHFMPAPYNHQSCSLQKSYKTPDPTPNTQPQPQPQPPNHSTLYSPSYHLEKNTSTITSTTNSKFPTNQTPPKNLNFYYQNSSEKENLDPNISPFTTETQPNLIHSNFPHIDSNFLPFDSNFDTEPCIIARKSSFTGKFAGKKSFCNKFMQTDMDIMAFEGPKGGFETFGNGLGGVECGDGKRWTRFEEFFGGAMARLEGFLGKLGEVEGKICKLGVGFFGKIDGFVGSGNYRSMETEMKGHVDVLSFN
jgi:hypothetical protein